MYALKKMPRQTFRLERLRYLDDFPLGTDHADVAGTCFDRPPQDPHVVAVAAGDDDDVRRLVRIEPLNRLTEIHRVHFAGVREALFGRIGGPIIGHNDVEPGRSSRPAKIK